VFQCSSTSRNCWNVWNGKKLRLSCEVSVLFNEPKLLKSWLERSVIPALRSFSALQRAEIAEIRLKNIKTITFGEFQCSSTSRNCWNALWTTVERWLRRAFQCSSTSRNCWNRDPDQFAARAQSSFSALQRAEIAEIIWNGWMDSLMHRFSALQRAEIAEINRPGNWHSDPIWFQCSSTSRNCWNPLRRRLTVMISPVSVLFNEPKLLKFLPVRLFSALEPAFQCSSTSRNCWNPMTTLISTKLREVSVLFNEPKLLKCTVLTARVYKQHVFQCSSTSRNCWNYQIIMSTKMQKTFQCSSTSRNCWNR